MAFDKSRTLLLLLALLGSATACSGGAVTGTFELQTVNGRRVPVQAGSHTRGGAEIVGGSIILYPDKSYQQRTFLRVRYDTSTFADSVIQAGLYTQKNGTLVLKSASGRMEGQVSDSVLMIELEGSRYRYRRSKGVGS
jgi:hypothetical protein